MEKLNRHISELSEALIAKGYDGQFLVCEDNAGRLPDSLMEYIKSFEVLKNLENSAFAMATHSEWKNESCDYNFCFFKVAYNEQSGFRIQEIEIERTNIYGDRCAKVTLPIKCLKDIPSRKQANEMVNPPLQKSIRSRKSLRH